MSRFVALSIIFAFFGRDIYSSAFELTILHTNDLHSKFEPAVEKGKSIGGMARVISFVERERKQASKQNKAFLYLDAGDMFTGSVWFIVHTTNITGEFMSMLDPDAGCVGNHEFDLGVEGLSRYIARTCKKMLCCNCDVSEEEHLKEKIAPSKLIVLQNTRIGIIGYIHKHTRTIDKYYGKVKILDETEPIRKEIELFKQSKTNIIIALSHAGYEYDMEVAKRFEDLDIIVGGHSHSLLYSGKDKRLNKKSFGPYPTIVKDAKGKPVYVVQADCHGKYVGKLDVVFDKKGVVTSAKGGPHAMDSTIPEDKKAARTLNNYRKEVDELRTRKIGTSYVILDGYGRLCRRLECNIGNMITDAFVFHQSLKHSKSDQTTISGTAAFITGGTINDGITPVASDYSITYAELLQALPYQNSLVTLTINGSVLRQVLERAISWPNTTHKDEFLQFSGIRVIYDFSRPSGQRVFSAKVRCTTCEVAKYEPLDDNATYTVTTVDFVASGGSGYKMLQAISPEHSQTWGDILEVVTTYMQSMEFLTPDAEERLVVLNDARFQMIGSRIRCDRMVVFCFIFIPITRYALI